jgi:uncharacterized SAM-binding protein YcdF (DUF218 family)
MKFDVLIVISGTKKYGIWKSRIEECLKLFEKRIARNIVVSGRYEAKLMKEYLVKNGVPRKIIFEENKSMDTVTNAFFSKLLFVLPKKWKTIAVVTSDFHKKRVEYTFKKFFGRQYKIKVFAVKTNADPVAMKNLILHEKGALETIKLLIKNSHILVMKKS